MYYIRKLSKPSSLYKIKALTDVKDLCADFLGQELRTADNTLSVWRSETLDDAELNKAINAALLASSQINTSQFLIFNSSDLSNAGIQVDDTQPGKTAYIGCEHLHTNLCDLTYEKIGKLLEIYCKVANNSQLTPKIEKSMFKEIICEANKAGVLNMSALQEHMQKEVGNLLENPV